MGHNILQMYLPRIDDNVIHSLEELSSMSHPIEFLKEMKNIFFNIIIDIFLGFYNKHIITKIGNFFTDMHAALFLGMTTKPIHVVSGEVSKLFLRWPHIEQNKIFFKINSKFYQ